MNIFCVPVVLAAAVILSSSVLPSSATEENDKKFRGNNWQDNAWIENFQTLNTGQGLKAHRPPSPRNFDDMAHLNNTPTVLQRQGTMMCEDPPNLYLLSLGQSVKFKSPNYPNKYPNNENCGWLIRSNDPNVRIKITCSKFRLQSPKKKVCGDYLALNQNYYCGEVIARSWISTTNEVPIWFKSNKRKNFKGFSCKAKAIDASSIDPTKCSANPVVNTLPAGASITLNTPQYPKKYGRNELCGWYIQGEDWSVRISVTCNDFILQDPSGNNNCPDYFLLPPYEYCGSNSPNGWLSSTSQTALFFSSNKKKQRKGFSCTADALGPSSYGIGASTNCKCGQVNRATRIIGGQVTEVNEYPWQVSLVEKDTNRTLCGGSIINNRWILSAAHCPAAVSNFQVVVGAHAWSNPPTSFQRLEYETYVYHPYYDYVTQDNDLVLIKLVDTLNFSDPAVAPICPPEPYSDYVGINATVTGWGFLSNDSTIQPDELQEVDITTINHTDCVASYPDYVVTTNMLCAGHPDGGKDSCQGDSGGPLITQEGDHYVQIGVVSWGVGCGEANHPGVYATIAHQLTWINSVASGGETCPS